MKRNGKNRPVNDRKVTVRVAGDRSLRAVRELDEEACRLRDLVDHATEFTFRPDYGDVNDEFDDDPEQQDAIVLSWRGPSEPGGDPDRWAIRWRNRLCWSRSESAFVHEPGGGNRSGEFVADTRFTLDEAVVLVPGMLARLETVRIPELLRKAESWAARDAVRAAGRSDL